MKILLFLLAILAFITGLEILYSAKSAIHEIEAFVLFIVSSVLFSGAAIVESVNKMTKELKSLS
ncbi:MAG: hypothetical protein COV66_03310 [Nitrospinae bacterium CG11_big_fil_rev_8_21_14_0_20_45_15]|nr:MAG: hypothetical protein COV66_03310 [Nitrospinae bacterium CG11_big_fil_rev_8_21_14_0_20_45_15]